MEWSAMAEKRIIEVVLECLRTNIPFVETEIVRFEVDRTGLRVDDTVGPLMNIFFKKCPQIKDGSNPEWGVKRLTILTVRIAKGSNGRRETIFERNLLEHDMKIAPLFQRYRLPFNTFESELHKNEGVPYIGNPNRFIGPGESVEVYIHSPFEIDPKKTKITLQFVELRGHIGPAEIEVK
jgi:hypothetical protein